jgi:hypothetical protein
MEQMGAAQPWQATLTLNNHGTRGGAPMDLPGNNVAVYQGYAEVHHLATSINMV